MVEGGRKVAIHFSPPHEIARAHLSKGGTRVRIPIGVDITGITVAKSKVTRKRTNSENALQEIINRQILAITNSG